MDAQRRLEQVQEVINDLLILADGMKGLRRDPAGELSRFPGEVHTLRDRALRLLDEAEAQGQSQDAQRVARVAAQELGAAVNRVTKALHTMLSGSSELVQAENDDGLRLRRLLRQIPDMGDRWLAGSGAAVLRDLVAKDPWWGETG